MRRILACLTILMSASVLAVEFTVSGTSDTDPPTPCVDGVCESLRAAVQAANALEGADTVILPAGTYVLEIVGAGEDEAATGDLDILDDLAIVGAGTGDTIIDADGIDRVFHVLNGGLTLQGVTVRNGEVTGENGGGILVFAAEGGGADAPLAGEGSTSLTLIDSIVSGNTAMALPPPEPGEEAIGGGGGGIYTSALMSLDGAVISGNSAATNGGGFYSGAVVELARSTVIGNQAENGGGIFETGSHSSNYSACAIAGNQAVGGGGMSTRTNVSILMTNCTIDGNTATDVGAGINSSGSFNLTNSTITDNRSNSDAPNGGAGLNAFSGGNFRMWNTLLAGNTVGSLDNPTVRNCGCTGGAGCTPGVQYLSLATNLEDADSCDMHPGSGDLINTDPGLIPLGLYGGPSPSRALAIYSPAIDAGTGSQGPFQCPDADQRGVPRPLDGDGDSTSRCDIGAVEFDPDTDPDLELIFRNGFEAND